MILLAQTPAKAVNELSGNGSQQMVVTPHDIGTFLVSSESGRNGVVAHLVDLAYLQDGHRKAKPTCGCESNFIYGRLCRHIQYVVEHERKRLGI